METMEKSKIEIGQVVNYTYPGMKLVFSGGTAKGKVIRLGKIFDGQRQVLVEDIEIQKGEDRLYQHWIGENQIQS